MQDIEPEQQQRPITRDVAVAFLVDLSSSTNEVVGDEGKRIIEVEKEALVCISEALDALGDRFAIYGFSGYGREHASGVLEEVANRLKFIHDDLTSGATRLKMEAFTRSLRLPAWLSTLLLHFDSHELHHMYPFVPGYHLGRVRYEPAHEVDWWTWMRASRRVAGEVLLFQNRAETGWEV